MTYGIGGTCAPGVLMGPAAGGVTPPTAITLYYDISLNHRTASRIGIDGTQDPNWGLAQGVPDVVTGVGTYGVAWNSTGDTGANVPPAPAWSTIQFSMTNLVGSTLMEIDALDYWTNWSFLGGGGGYLDFINYGGFADGGTGVGVTWAWSVVITAQSLSSGTVAVVTGTPILLQDGSFGVHGWTGVGEYVTLQSGRTGGPLPGDTLNIEVTVTATNAGGTATGVFANDINWV